MNISLPSRPKFRSSCAVDAHGVEWGNVVYGGPIVGGQLVDTRGGGVIGEGGRRHAPKIVQPANAAGDSGESGGNRDSRGVGEVRLAIDEIAVNWVWKTRSTSRAAAERYPVARPGDILHMQAMRFEPGAHSGIIAGRRLYPAAAHRGQPREDNERQEDQT